MIVVRGADKAVVGDVHQLPEVKDAALALDDAVDELLRGDAGLPGLLLYLLAVLIRAGEEHHVVAAHSLVARNGIRRDGAVGMADVQFVGRIIDGGGDVECAFLAH